MIDSPKLESNQDLPTLSKKQILTDNKNAYIEDQLSIEEVEELINNLTIPELFTESAEKLIYYFSNSPYIYNMIYIEVLFEYFLEENEQPDHIITVIGEILNSLFSYNEQSISVLEVMKNEDFCSIIWPYIDRIPSIMTLYKWLIKTFSCVFDFVMKNDICSKLSMIIYPESENTPVLFNLISSFAGYKDYYHIFTSLINAVCEMTFCTTNMEIFKAGIACISEFTRRSVDCALEIFKNPYFFDFCSELEQGHIFSFEAIIDLIDKTLQNREIYLRNQEIKSSLDALIELLNDDESELFKQIMFSAVNAAVIIIEQIQSNNIDESFLMPAAKALSMFIYGPEMTQHYIETNIHSFLFEIAHNGEIAFPIHVEVFKAICKLVSSSFYEEANTFIKMNFITLVEDQIEMMVKLPNTTIDALSRIIDLSESCEEAKEWSNLIFGSETIISQLQYVVDHPDEIDEDNYAQDLVQNASSLLQRRPDD